jgi:hypothetical protein
VNDALKDSTRGSTTGAHGRLRGGLLVGESSLSLVLLIAAGLLLTSFARLQKVSAGFDPARIFVGGVAIPATKYPTREQLVSFYNQLYARLGTLPGVSAVSMSDRVPLTGNNTPAPMAVAGRPLQPMGERPTANRHLITPGFFATFGIPMLRGRDFNERDTPASPHVAIVNEAFVKQYFPGEDPMGRTIITGMGQAPSEIVGVVADIRATDLNTPPQPDYYRRVVADEGSSCVPRCVRQGREGLSRVHALGSTPANKPLKLTAAGLSRPAAVLDTRRDSITCGRSLAAIR